MLGPYTRPSGVCPSPCFMSWISPGLCVVMMRQFSSVLLCFSVPSSFAAVEHPGVGISPQFKCPDRVSVSVQLSGPLIGTIDKDHARPNAYSIVSSLLLLYFVVYDSIRW